MESEKVNDIVEETFTKVDLSVMNKHHGLNWKGQLQAVLNFVPGCGGFLAQELQKYLDYRDNEFLRKYTTYIMELSDMSVDDRLEFAKEVGAKAKDASGNVIANIWWIVWIILIRSDILQDYQRQESVVIYPLRISLDSRQY